MNNEEFKEDCINILRIEHDDWCETLKSGSGLDCNCSPVTRMVPLESEEDIQRYFAGEEK
jgi:hypothetical protein